MEEPRSPSSIFSDRQGKRLEEKKQASQVGAKGTSGVGGGSTCMPGVARDLFPDGGMFAQGGTGGGQAGDVATGVRGGWQTDGERL